MFDLHQPVSLVEVIITGVVVLSLMALGYYALKKPQK